MVAVKHGCELAECREWLLRAGLRRFLSSFPYICPLPFPSRLLLYPESEGSKQGSFRNFSNFIFDYTASYSISWYSSYSEVIECSSVTLIRETCEQLGG
jgi:hypothetical protein